MRCILDLGCGNCDLEQYLAGEDQHVVTGVDVRDGSFPTAQDSAPVAQGLVNCIKADAAHLDFLGDAGMDGVVSVWALHEMHDPADALREAFRILRPGGKILLVDFPRGSLAQRLWDEKYYAVPEVERMLGHAGFARVSAQAIERGQVIWAEGSRRVEEGLDR